MRELRSEKMSRFQLPSFSLMRYPRPMPRTLSLCVKGIIVVVVAAVLADSSTPRQRLLLYCLCSGLLRQVAAIKGGATGDVIRAV